MDHRSNVLDNYDGVHLTMYPKLHELRIGLSCRSC